MKERVSAKRNPLFKGQTPLLFDDFEEKELLELTDQQQADKFMSRWLEVFHPFTRYKRYFEETDKSNDRILKEIKNYYSKYVVQGKWPEKKYVVIIDSILLNRFSITPKTFEAREKLFNEKRLEAQLLEKRLTRRSRI